MAKKKTDNENVAAEEQQTDDLQIDDGDYDAAFDEATGDLQPVASAEVSEEEEDTQKRSAEDEGSETTPPSGEEEETPAATETPAPAAADTNALRSRIAELETQLAERTKPPETPAASPEPAALSDEDQETLDEVAEDWPLINRTLEIRIKQLEDRIATLIDKKVGAVTETIKPIAKTAQETAQERFKKAVTDVHADAFTLLPEVEKWVEKQPAFLQPGYNNVLDRGSVKEVCDLLDTFKKATGRPLPSDDPSPETGTSQDDKANRLARMEGVRTQRTGLSTEDDPSDFDGAFEKAASQ